ncbi:MAG: magnesium transporter CorA family protein [Gaiellaceae bacterium]
MSTSLREPFGFHPLAVEDSEHFGQRPKAEDYEDFVFLVFYGWSPDEDGLVEVHCFVSERFLVTVRRDEGPALDSLRRRYERDPTRFPRGALVLYEVLDRLVDGFFPVLDQLDERLELIEEHMFTEPKPEHLEDIFSMKRRLVRLRRVLAPQRDLLGRIVGGGIELPGMTSESDRYFRDVYDHLVRLTEAMDGNRELMNAAIDAYLSTASNRLNVTTKQLAVIATIFLPLTFVTGFFGQNFGWMVDHVDSWQAFVALGLGLEVVTLVALLALFRLRGWF